MLAEDSPRSDSPKYGNAPDSSKHKPKKHKRDKPKDQPDARLHPRQTKPDTASLMPHIFLEWEVM
eukprot:2422534-Amphidinium_carterae.2